MMKYRILLILIAFGLNATAQKKQAVATPKVAVQSDSIAPVKAPAVKKKGIEVNPVKVWKNGASVNGVDLDVAVAYEDFENMVRFYYELKDSTGAQIANGNVEVTGADYDDYKSKPNHDKRAYQIVLRYLRLQQKPSIQN
jgi:hypothetical protein